MAHAQSLRQLCRNFMKLIALFVIIFLLAASCFAQTPQEDHPLDKGLQEYLSKHPGLLEALLHLLKRLQTDLKYPPQRTESRLLPLLPQSTVGYAGVPNYGDLLHQSVTIFHQEIDASSPLREWWQGPEMASVGPVFEMVLDKIYQLSQFMGDELVLSVPMEEKHTGILLIAEIKKPGLKEFLNQTIGPFITKPNSPVRILMPQELASAEAPPAGQKLLLLVRPDFFVASFDLETLRSFSAELDRGTREFAGTPFGQRLIQAYQGGVTSVEAADLQRMLAQFPPQTDRAKKTLQLTGFGDAKYVVWEHKRATGQTVSLSELSFTAPRHGFASWLAAPAPMGGLDFVSPRAVAALSMILKSPAQIFDDLKQLATISDPKAFAHLEQMEQSSHVSLRDDVLSRLGGEITLELDDFSATKVVGAAVLQASDPAHLQPALATLLTAAHFKPEKSELDGVAFYTFQVPSSKQNFEVSYAFADGYLIAASSRERAMEVIRTHRSGESLGKSKKFLASLAPGCSASASATFYQNQTAMSAMSVRQVSPDLASSLEKLFGEGSPAAGCAYGEPAAIRVAGTSSTAEAGIFLVGAAIVIPNIMRSKIHADEAGAIAMVRAINTAQVSYAASYPDRGFAPDLAKLGPHPLGPSAATSTHANLIDATLGNSKCTAGAWCEKAGYRFIIMAECMQRFCKDYAVVSLPVSSDTAVRSFCSTSDGVIRFKVDPPLNPLVSPSVCRSWSPLP